MAPRRRKSTDAPDDRDIFVDVAAREAAKRRRLELGLTTRSLAQKFRLKVSHGTISNFETNKHPTVSSVFYGELRRLLFGEKPDSEDTVSADYQRILDNLPAITGDDLVTVRSLVESLANRRKSGS